jgi:pSer/pThr/pTyr-binding forkhead associated (FHA) protein
MICSRCGKENRSQNRFCSHCGQALIGVASQPFGETKPDTPSATLLVLVGAQNGNVFDLPASEHNIGRELNNDVVLHDPHVSKLHAKIYYHDQRYWIADLNSRNGVQVNGKTIKEPEPLLNGALIKLGETIVKFVLK